MLGDFFYSGDESFDAREIASDDEVKTVEQLQVDLPADNADFNSLALRLAESLPCHTQQLEQPDGKPASTTAGQQEAQRQRLREVVRAKDYRVHALPSGQAEAAGVKAAYWKLVLDGDWTLPVVELVNGQPEQTAILVADAGRTGAVEDAVRLMGDGYRVLAVDPFYFGESSITDRGSLFALLIAGVGERPLGIQASQLAAVAKWSTQQRPSEPVTLVARGPRTSLIALISAAMDTEPIAQLQVHEALGSLKDVLRNNWNVNERPELFCFGLLEAFDIPQLEALVAPRSIVRR